MSVSEIRSKVRAVILGITGLLIAFLFARVVLDLIQADKQNPFVEFIKQISDFLAEPFESLAVNDTGVATINVDALISIFMYFIIGLILSEIITAFIYDNLEDIIQNFIDAIFKIFEFIFFLRIVFDFFEVNERAKFISGIYDLTNWSNNLIQIDPLDGRINFSAIIMLIIIIIFDILTESLLRGVLKPYSKRVTVNTNSAPNSVNHVTVSPIPTHSSPVQPIHQNITVNIPAQRPMTTVIAPAPTRAMASPIPTRATTTNVSVNPPQNYERFQNQNGGNKGGRNESLGSKIKKFFGS